MTGALVASPLDVASNPRLSVKRLLPYTLLEAGENDRWKFFCTRRKSDRKHASIVSVDPNDRSCLLYVHRVPHHLPTMTRHGKRHRKRTTV